MNKYNAAEVFQFAIRIEENGEKFYKKLSEAVDDKDAKELFKDLSKEEVTHAQVFKRILSNIEDYGDTDIYPEEYFAYLHALANNMIFNKDLDKELAGIKSRNDALKFAMQQEWEAILYYQEIKNL
ncbi:MAG: ferritin family protein, partial [Spirochaetota bacterium]|nr:ferritin family protein [Spirochaetota bacterium]